MANANQETSEVLFQLRGPDGQQWELRLDGTVTGFPEGTVVTNHAAPLLARLRLAAGPRVYGDAIDDVLDARNGLSGTSAAHCGGLIRAVNALAAAHAEAVTLYGNPRQREALTKRRRRAAFLKAREPVRR